MYRWFLAGTPGPIENSISSEEEISYNEENVKRMDIRKDLKFKVNRLKVLKKLRFHRENFERLLKESLSNYQSECVRLLYERIDEINHICGGKFEEMTENELKGLLEFNLSPPKNFLYLYNEAIEILSSISDEYIELNGEQINAFINNKWIIG